MAETSMLKTGNILPDYRTLPSISTIRCELSQEQSSPTSTNTTSSCKYHQQSIDGSRTKAATLTIFKSSKEEKKRGKEKKEKRNSSGHLGRKSGKPCETLLRIWRVQS